MDDAEQPTEQGFLRSIQANPLDRLPRLAYADWLDERGDDRAELLRLQCQVVAGLERLDELSGRVPAEWVRQVDLLAAAVVVYRMPQLGEAVERATILSIAGKVGQRLIPDDELVSIETDKAWFELRIEFDCIVLALLVAPGETLPVGSPLALLLRV